MTNAVQFHHRYTLPAALSLLPGAMDTRSARAMLLAIALQESRFKYRYQVLDHGRKGAARGFWQFEVGGGVTGVLTHSATRPVIERVLAELRYVPAASACYDAMEHHDVLACAFARLLLFTVPGHLPEQGQADKAWHQYLAGWRPGKPHRETWDEFFDLAWSVVVED
jgi:hypothetical protein